MSKFYQNLLLTFLFLLGHSLSPAMSKSLLGASCPNGKVMVCCYNTPYVCYAWTWPCDDNEVEQCCKKTDNVGIGAFEKCQDPIGPETQSEPARDSQGLLLDPGFNSEFGINLSSPPPTPAAPQSAWTDWILPLLTAPWRAGAHAKSFNDNPATP